MNLKGNEGSLQKKKKIGDEGSRSGSRQLLGFKGFKTTFFLSCFMVEGNEFYH